MNDRKPAEVWPVGVYLGEELDARGWSMDDLVIHMPHPGPYAKTALIGILRDPVPGLWLAWELAQQIGAALGTDPEFWLNLDRSWQEANGYA